MLVITELAVKIFPRHKTDPIGARLLKAATGTFGLRIAYTGFSFITSVLLARLLGADGYGTYSYVMAWIALLGVAARFGLDRLLVREIAVYRNQLAWNLVSGVVRWANRTALILSLGLGVLAGGVVWVLTDRLGLPMSTAFWLGLSTLPLVTLVALRQAALHGFNHVVLGLLPDLLVRPLSFIILLGVAYLFLPNAITPHGALGLYAAALIVAFVFATHLLRKMFPEPARETSPAYKTEAWLYSALPMILISGMNVINHRMDILMLGTIKGTEEVGLYTVAERGAHLIALVQTAAGVALAPTIAALSGADKRERLQQVTTSSVRGVSVVSLLIAASLILFGDQFLAFFGSEFIQAYGALVILIAGYVVNTSTGIASLVLIMTKHERDAALSTGIGVALNVGLNAALIPYWGVEGAATATATSMIIRNILAAVVLHRRLGVDATFLGGFARQREADDGQVS